MELITLEVGSTRLQTQNAKLASQVLAHATSNNALPRADIFPAINGTAPLISRPPIGSYWLGQGGIYAGMVRGENGTPDYHLIVSTDSSAQVEEITWGAYGESESGATNLRDGQANTKALLDSTHDHPTAQWAAGLSIEGHDDWYLPARHELRLCYLNVPELFNTEDWYWSSTQYSPHYAWIQDFDDGNQDNDHKGNALRARAVRRVVNP